MDEDKDEGEGLSQAALYAGWLMFLYALMQFICAPVMGNLSDRFGRRTRCARGRERTEGAGRHVVSHRSEDDGAGAGIPTAHGQFHGRRF